MKKNNMKAFKDQKGNVYKIYGTDPVLIWCNECSESYMLNIDSDNPCKHLTNPQDDKE